jgi:hypothetical protein
MTPALFQRNKHRHPHASLPDPHARIPAVEKQVTNLQFAEITLDPSLEVFAQAPDQARHRILRQRRAAQERGQCAPQSTHFGAAQVNPQNRFVDSFGPALIARNNPGLPLVVPSNRQLRCAPAAS